MNRSLIQWQQLAFPLFLIALASCALNPAEPPSALQLQGIRATSVVVAPFNIALPLPSELKSSRRLVSGLLIQYLKEHGKKSPLIESELGRQLWLESTREVLASPGPRNFETAARSFVRKLRERIDFDVIIMPSLYVQNAVANPQEARWDSANQQIQFIGRSRKEIEMPPISTIPAASLLVHVLDVEGNLIHTRRTGLELIAHMEIRIERKQGFDRRIWTLKDDDPAIEDGIRVGAAIAHALDPFLPK